jgi:hypothetical protein
MTLTRRSIILGTGALAVGGGLVVGSGAFGGTSASRSVTVEFADDSDAYLAIGPISGDEREHVAISEGANGVVEIQVDQVNANARTVISDLVAFKNNSPREIVDLTVTIDDQSENADISVTNMPESIDPGETITGLGLVVDTLDYSGNPELMATIQIRTVLAAGGSS